MFLPSAELAWNAQGNRGSTLSCPSSDCWGKNHLVKEAIEIELHHDSFNSDMGFVLSCSWQIAANMSKEGRAF
jgi:hypothetical protein